MGFLEVPIDIFKKAQMTVGKFLQRLGKLVGYLAAGNGRSESVVKLFRTEESGIHTRTSCENKLFSKL
jgi:hypothetical protein